VLCPLERCELLQFGLHLAFVLGRGMHSAGQAPRFLSVPAGARADARGRLVREQVGRERRQVSGPDRAVLLAPSISFATVGAQQAAPP
jgi:hypothetical protein